MTTTTIDAVLTQAEALTPEDQLLLLARLANHVRMVYHHQSPRTRKRTIDQIISASGYNGGTFKTAEDVDAYIRAERDSWNR